MVSADAPDPMIAGRDRLAAHLAQMVPNFGALGAVTKFTGGQSNPTYLVEGEGGRYVLRKKPAGTLLPGAHQIEREYRVMRAVGAAGAPVPPLWGLCEDPEIIGTPFYVMDFAEGRIFRDVAMPGCAAEERAAAYLSMAGALARLHAIDWRTFGLEGFGKEKNYLARQVATWTRQFDASRTHDIPAMDKLIAWLPANLPPDRPATIIHGDYRVENLVFALDRPEVVAILDWELATLGDPMADLAHNCTSFHLPSEMAALGGLADVDLASLGILDEQSYIAQYCAAAGRALPENWSFYIALALFRITAILQGVYKRSMSANASSAEARSVGALAPKVAEAALGMI